MTWIARIHEHTDDATQARDECRSAVKEYNGNHEVFTEPVDWRRRVGYWVD